jgi:adenylate kinase family enzyme
MPTSNRIVVLGCAGTGKSTLARSLGLPTIILDEVWPQPLLSEDVPRFRELVEHLHAGEEWVSDGNYAAASFDLRLPRATRIVWLEAPRWLCLWRTLKRAVMPGTDHRLRDYPRVAKFIWNFDRVNRPRIEGLIHEHGPHVPIVHLRNSKATLADLEQ